MNKKKRVLTCKKVNTFKKNMNPILISNIIYNHDQPLLPNMHYFTVILTNKKQYTVSFEIGKVTYNRFWYLLTEQLKELHISDKAIIQWEQEHIKFNDLLYKIVVGIEYED